MEVKKPEPSTATRGGLYVLWFSAVAIALRFGAAAPTTFDRCVIAVVTAGILFGIYKLHGLIRDHGDEIGEARFDTRNKGE